MEKLRKKYHRKQSLFKQGKKLHNSSSWVISNWQPSVMSRRVRSGHEITVKIESPPIESHHSTDTISFNNDDDDNDDEDNWSDISVL